MKIKEITFFIIKSVLAVVLLITLVLFFYAAFFYEPTLERNVTENQIIKDEAASTKEEKEKLKENELEESEKSEKISSTETEQTNTTTEDTIKIKEIKITDGIFMTIGNKAITHSDIVNEIKILLILNNESYSQDKRDRLQKLAVQSIIKRKIKAIEVERNNFFEFSRKDFNSELTRLANNINTDVETLKNICASNELDFSIIEDNIKVDLMWNSIIFQLYKDKLSINTNEIYEKLKLSQSEKKEDEYLISEILVQSVELDMLESIVKDLKNNIKIEGFENVAKNLSISKSSLSGGDLGWVNENSISEKVKTIILNTPVGELSEPMVLPEGILIFKIRDKRKIETNLSLEEQKEELVKLEKLKLLKMHSLSHYDKIKRTISMKFL